MSFFKARKIKIGLALGSGAAKGFAHIGVLRAMKENNIKIDFIAGTSMGAIVGAYFARHMDVKGLEEAVSAMNSRDIKKMADPNVAFIFKGIIYGKKIKHFLKKMIGDVRFSDLKIPLSVVAADVNTGEEIVINEGSVIDAVMASISIPVIFTPVKRGERFLVDGGIVNPVPVDTVRDMGADFVIASNVMQMPKRRGLGNHSSFLSNINDKFRKIAKDRYGREFDKIHADTPNIADVVINTVYIMEQGLVKSKIKHANVLIAPDTKDIALMEFHKAAVAIEAGYTAAKTTSFFSCKSKAR